MPDVFNEGFSRVTVEFRTEMPFGISENTGCFVQIQLFVNVFVDVFQNIERITAPFPVLL